MSSSSGREKGRHIDSRFKRTVHTSYESQSKRAKIKIAIHRSSSVLLIQLGIMRAQEMDTDQLYYWFGNGVTWVIPKTRGYPNHCESALIGREVCVRVRCDVKIFCSAQLQSQTKIVGTLKPNAVFFLLVLPSCLSKLFIAVQSPNLVHQHWGDRETQKCPNNFDWDCSIHAITITCKKGKVLS